MPKLAVDDQADALIALYTQAELRLAAAAQEALSSGQLGTARYRRKRLAAVQAILKQLQFNAIPRAKQLVVDGYKEGISIAGGPADFGGGIHTEAIRLLQKNMTGSLDDATTTVGRRVEDVFRREGLRAAALGLIEGSTRKEASAGLAAALRAQGLKAFQDVAGRQWNLEAYARMVIRTTTREAVTAGTGNRLAEQGIDLVEISLSLKACPRCVAAYKGKVFSRTGATPGYPVLIKPPPLHPNDRCIMHAARQNLAALETSLGITAAV